MIIDALKFHFWLSNKLYNKWYLMKTSKKEQEKLSQTILRKMIVFLINLKGQIVLLMIVNLLIWNNKLNLNKWVYFQILSKFRKLKKININKFKKANQPINNWSILILMIYRINFKIKLMLQWLVQLLKLLN